MFEGKATEPMMKPIPLFPPDSKSKLQKTRGKRKETHFTKKNRPLLSVEKGENFSFYILPHPPQKKHTTPNQTTTTCSLEKSHDGKNLVGFLADFLKASAISGAHVKEAFDQLFEEATGGTLHFFSAASGLPGYI